MTKLPLAVFFLAIALAGCRSKDGGKNAAEIVVTPPYAASTMTWTFGDQTWSDAIHCPECNKESFADSDTDPQCRSYTADGNTWYYYNRPYVALNAETLCPAPWHIPTNDEYLSLLSGAKDAAAYAGWRSGGYIIWNEVYWYMDAGYWSLPAADDAAPSLINDFYAGYGFMVRCVKE
jgi:hypothetical protein